MGMQIIINDTDNLSPVDKAVLAVLAGGAIPAEKTSKSDLKPGRRKKDPEPFVEKEEDAPEVVEEDGEDEPDEEATMADAVALATECVSQGRQKDVKNALVDLGVAKVSKLKGDQIAEFIQALS